MPHSPAGPRRSSRELFVVERRGIEESRVLDGSTSELTGYVFSQFPLLR